LNFCTWNVIRSVTKGRFNYERVWYLALPRNNDTTSFFLTQIPKWAAPVLIFHAFLDFISLIFTTTTQFLMLETWNITLTTRFVRKYLEWYLFHPNQDPTDIMQPIWGLDWVYNWPWWSTQQWNGLEALHKEHQTRWKAKLMKMNLPAWFCHLEIRLKRKEVVSLFLGSAIRPWRRLQELKRSRTTSTSHNTKLTSLAYTPRFKGSSGSI